MRSPFNRGNISNTVNPRANNGIKIFENKFPSGIQIRLNKFFHRIDEENRCVSIYVRNSNEYKRFFAEINTIRGVLNKHNYSISVFTVCEANIVNKMNENERREFVEHITNF